MDEPLSGSSAVVREGSSRSAPGMERQGAILRYAWRRLLRNRGATLAMLLLIVVILGVVLAPILSKYSPDQMATGAPLARPSFAHVFGTDRYGRDLWTRVLYGGRLSLPIGLIAVAVSAGTGAFVGLVTGFFGGRIDMWGSKVIDIMLGFPSIMLALLIIAVLGVGIQNVIIAVGLSGIPWFGRVIRGLTISVRENTYIEAARSCGASGARIMLVHILPNISGTLIVLCTLYVGRAILQSSSLGFLGLGVQPPTSEWGTMLSEGREFMRYAPWLMLFPGLTLFAVVVSVNLIGDYLWDVFEPTRRKGVG